MQKIHIKEYLQRQIKKEEIDFMVRTSYFLYYENDKSQIIKLKYKCQCSAYIILPKEEYTIDNYIENISSLEISQMLNSLEEKEYLYIYQNLK